MVTGTQMSKTQIILNGIAYYIENDPPTSMLIGFPNEKEGKQFVRTRIDPMMTTTLGLKKLIGTARKGHRQHDRLQGVPGGFLKRATGEAATRSCPPCAAIVWLDEYDAFPRTSRAREGGKELADQAYRHLPWPREDCRVLHALQQRLADNGRSTRTPTSGISLRA